MKLDAHVHTYYSGNTTIKPIDRLLMESYSTPEEVYRVAKRRGMDLVTITDHNSIAGVLTIADRSDVIVGCEVTAVFPEDGVNCHIGVLGINETQHPDIQRLRSNALELAQYLQERRIFSILNHVASTSAGRLSASHIFALLPWIDAVEIRNGTRLRSQNRTAAALAHAHGKVTAAGSDSHTYRGIGKTYITCENARNRDEFLIELRRGRVHAGGRDGCRFTLAADILRLAARFYADGLEKLIEHPFEWRRYMMVVGATLALPLTAVALAGSLIHYILDERFNRALLLDLVAHSIDGRRAAPPQVRELEPAF